MPWCEPCSHYYAPNTLLEDGDCPQCGEHIADPHEEDIKVPWHFWLLLTAASIYLVWRIVQMIGWVVT
ncbi:MAG: hypothetical protein U5R31_10920 [Acidimicrobiia bacterium]|nr:hypothetical protein [Acidimicrobiia bacterium]